MGSRPFYKNLNGPKFDMCKQGLILVEQKDKTKYIHF